MIVKITFSPLPRKHVYGHFGGQRDFRVCHALNVPEHAVLLFLLSGCILMIRLFLVLIALVSNSLAFNISNYTVWDSIALAGSKVR